MLQHEIQIEFEKPLFYSYFDRDDIKQVDGYGGEPYGRDGGGSTAVAISAVVTFHKGHKTKGRLRFEITSNNIYNISLDC